MNPYEVKARTVKAMKVAAALAEFGATAQDVMRYDATIWGLAARAAGILPPSDKTKELVVSILATQEASAGSDPFKGL